MAGCLQQCDDLVQQATAVLRGTSRTLLVQRVMTSACQLLGLLESASPPESKERQAAVAAQKVRLTELDREYREAASRDVQLVYTAGLLLGLGGIVLYATAVGSILARGGVSASSSAAIAGYAIAGAVGALVSIMSRVNEGTLALKFDLDLARGFVLLIGSMRAFIGMVFGLLAFFAVTSGFVKLFVLPASGSDERFYFLCAVAFLAGFSERWAQDTFTGGLTGRGARNQADPYAQSESARTPGGPQSR